MTTSVHRGNVTIEAMGHMAHHTDTLNKTVKTAEQGVNLAKIVAELVPGGQGVAVGLGLLSGQLKTTKTVINATNVVERGYEWGTSKTRQAILSCWQKTANRVALTFAQFLETVSFIDKCTIGFFYQASLIVCNLPILDVVKNCLYMTSAVFGLWYAGQDMSKALSTIHKAKEKKREWSELDVATADKDALRDKYQAMLDQLGKNSGQLSASIKTVETRIRKNQDLLPTLSGDEAKRKRAEIKRDATRLSALKTSLVSAQKYEGYIKAIDADNVKSLKDYKVEKYETRMKNNWKIHEKSWISIVVDVGKIVMISLGMFIAAMAATFPVLTLPATALVVTSLSLVSNAFGLTKNIYSVVAPKPVKEPVFAAA